MRQIDEEGLVPVGFDESKGSLGISLSQHGLGNRILHNGFVFYQLDREHVVRLKNTEVLVKSLCPGEPFFPVAQVPFSKGGCRVAERLQEPAYGFLPARKLLGFFAAGARHLELEDFAFRAVLRAPGSKIGSWGRLIPRCWRLRDALHCFCVQLAQDAPFLDEGVHYDADHAWLWRRRHLPPKDALAEQQGEEYTLASMLRVVRAAAGPSWSPRTIRAESPASDWLLRAEGLGTDAARRCSKNQKGNSSIGTQRQNTYQQERQRRHYDNIQYEHFGEQSAFTHC